MQTPTLDYIYERAHYPNNNSWYRELVWHEGVLVAEISEPTDSTPRNKIYRVRKYEPMEIVGGHTFVANTVATFSTVCDCKDYINNGGIK